MIVRIKQSGLVCSFIGINYLRSRGLLICLAALAAIAAVMSLSGCVGLTSATPHAPGSGALSTNPSSISFGDVEVGTSSTQTLTFSNAGGTSLTISQAALSGTGFTMVGQSFPVSLAPGQSSNLGVQFAPSAVGSMSGSVSLPSNAHNSPTIISLAGSGAQAASGQLSSNPASINFGNVVVASGSVQTVTLTNTGNSPVAISQATVSGAGFSVTGIAAPLTL